MTRNHIHFVAGEPRERGVISGEAAFVEHKCKFVLLLIRVSHPYKQYIYCGMYREDISPTLIICKTNLHLYQGPL